MAIPTASPAKQESSLRSGKKRKQQPPDENAVELQPPPRKRTKSPGVRVVGGRIYDSELGKTCHQCRQKTMDFSARCCNEKNKKQCTINFCFKCLLNRYGENAEEVMTKGDWICPKCRGICNCSCCMKKRGHEPTGILAHTAKAIGCSSVSELLKLDQTDSISEKISMIHKKKIESEGKPRNGNSLKKRRINETDAVSEKIAIVNKKNVESVGKLKKGKSLENRTDETDAKVHKKKVESVEESKKGNSFENDSENGTILISEKIPVVGKRKVESVEKLKKGKSLENRKKSETDSICEEKAESVGKPRKGKSLENGIKNETDSTSEKKAESVGKLKKGNSLENGKKNRTSGVSSPKKKKKLGKSSEGNGLGRVTQNSGESNLERETLPQGEVLEQAVTKSGKKQKKKVGKKKSDTVGEIISDIKSEEIEFVDDVKSNGVLKAGREKKITKFFNPLNGTTIEDKIEGLAVIFQKKKIPKPELTLPQGTPFRTIAGIELENEDVGPALQFLEFCSVFGKLLGISVDQPESILRELVNGRGARRGVNSKIVQFYIKVLSMIWEEREDEDVSFSANDGNWMRAIQKCVEESHISFNDLNLNSIAKSASGYAALDSSKKLKILNFLCDELLGTSEARNFIDNENSKFKENKKGEIEEKKIIEKKINEEVAQAMIELRDGKAISFQEQTEILSRLKTDLKKAKIELRAISDEKKASVLRIQPLLREKDGRAYWRLKGYDDAHILLQEIGELSSTAHRDQWFCYGSEEEKSLQKYMSSARIIRRKGKLSQAMANDG